MSIRHQNVQPAIVIHVEEANAPSQKARVDTHSAGISAVFKSSVAEIGVKRICVTSEVGFHHIKGTVSVVITNRNTHSRLRLAFG